ncbi:hypothetical protein [Neobacillus sp. PS3-40]|uniref:hypothetical protein n=1 Tax=Neobacillus sp. PS3-40 TaxID=3070679 RepID=UPI0027E1CFEF|nr:hypothetical protein [Neobacillus sp. PS3-40]WML45913.1 hypothetical protein RCG20_08535 [Neobacillus sp. PS3-40]
MMESVQNFIMTIKERNHVLQLINTIDFLSVRLVSGNMSLLLAITNGELLMIEDEDEEINTCKISGEIETIKTLLKGNEKLRILLNRGLLKIYAPFRTILLLESIFYLTKAEKRNDENSFKKYIDSNQTLV